MRQGRSSSSSNTLAKLKQEPHLSGAYIRSLVKQLTSSKSKDSPMSPDNSLDAAFPVAPNPVIKIGQEAVQKQPQPAQHKKQVRRRLHTSRPYQERLLNMAEARREIVTALKFHRASMKQASEQQQQQQQQQEEEHVVALSRDSPGKTVKPRRSHRASSDETRYEPTPSFPQYYYPQNTPLYNWPPPNSLSFDHQNLPLPNQALGLNLNLHDFSNIDLETPFQAAPETNPSPTSSSSVATSGAPGSEGLHAAMDEEEIAEIRSLGDQHQMEWDDTVSLMTSAYWFKFLRPDDHCSDGFIGSDHCSAFDEGDQRQVMDFPAWLSGNEQPHFDDYYSSDDYFHSPSLPCMEIGEIEGMDVGEDWLA